MDTKFFDKIEGDFTLANPMFYLIMKNEVGIPAEINLNLAAQNNSGQSEALSCSFELLTPSNLDSEPVTQTVEFNKENSNIVNFIALPPSGNITYSGDIRYNADGVVSPSNPNFFYLDDSLKIDVGLDLPFELQIENLVFQDTVEVDGGDYDMIKSAQLIINAINQIPLDVDLQLFFVDTISGQNYGSPIESSFLTGGSINNPSTSQNTITLEEEDMNNLQKANGIVFKGFISSPQNGTQTATIYSESRLNVNVAIRSKIDLSN